jgi:hypothetical protein
MYLYSWPEAQNMLPQTRCTQIDLLVLLSFTPEGAALRASFGSSRNSRKISVLPNPGPQPNDGQPRLLVLACSARKAKHAGSRRAIDLYDGPRFQLLRRYLRVTRDKQLGIAVLSARHGLISASSPIDLYNRKMTPKRARALRPQVLKSLSRMAKGREDVFVVVSATYAEALVGCVSMLGGRRLTTATGGQGARLGQMRRWLYRLPMVDRADEKFAFRGEARLGGKTVRLSPDEIRDIGLRELASAGSEATRFRDWFVELGTKRVSSKWLVSVLTGVPVQKFQAYEARRVLAQLGVPSKRVDWE